MKKIIISILILISFKISVASPRISFEQLLIQSELNPQNVKSARDAAIEQGLPLNILSKGNIMFDAKGIEDGKVVYAVFKDFANPYNAGFTAFFEEAEKYFVYSNSKIDYGNGNITDNTSGFFNPVISDNSGNGLFLMVSDWTYDRVYLFNAQNGDLIDTAFVHYANPQLQSPKHALQHFSGRYIIVADQISDVVQKFDTAGAYVGFYAPASGPNPAILDNTRGIRFRANNNLQVTVASGTSMNTIQQFDTAGNHIGVFISANVNSPFDIMLRQNDMLITNSSGGNRITRFDLNGNFLSNFYSGSSINFPQQMLALPNTNIAVAGFSSPSGIIILDSDGNYIRSLSAVTGIRGVYLLGNGNYLGTNATGVHEIDSATGNLLRTVITGTAYQYISVYNPDLIVSTNNNLLNIPEKYFLHQNFPNPFNPTTKINYSIPNAQYTILKVYNVLGIEVATLVNEKQNAGSYEIEFSPKTAGKELPSGIYYYTLSTEKFSQTKQMILIK